MKFNPGDGTEALDGEVQSNTKLGRNPNCTCEHHDSINDLIMSALA